MCALGLDGIQIVGDISDPVEHLFALAVAERLEQRRAEEREDLAVRIVNALAKAMRKQ